MSNPIWIILDNGDMFEGSQLQWADCFFSNATRALIESECARLYGECKLEIREMTDAEVTRMPESVTFRDWLIKEYGEA